MSARALVLVLLGSAVIGLAASARLWGPPALRHVSLFDIQRVEVAGMHMVAPHEVLATSGIRLGQNLWDDPEPWLLALRSHPGLADASIERVLPRTLRIRVEERRPVGLIEGGVLRAVTANGEILPVNPARASLDLPLVREVVEEAGDRIEDQRVLMVLGEVGRMSVFDPHLYARISEVSSADEGHLVLTLADPSTRVLLPAGAGNSRLRQLRAVLEDLEQRGASAKERSRTPTIVDLRFADQVVVRLSS